MKHSMISAYCCCRSGRVLLKFLIGLCATFATTAGFGQMATNYTWTGAANGTNLSTAANWTTNGVDPATTLPNGHGSDGITPGDTAQWDGKTTTNLVISYGTVSLPNTGFNSRGINLVLTANQTNSVQIISSVAVSAGVGVNNINVASGAGAFTLGDNTANNLYVIGRPAGAIHSYVNNSTNPATLNPSVRWEAGGGSAYTYDFSGSGNWIVNSYLMPGGGAFSPTFVQVDGPGTVFWSAGKTGAYNPNSALGPVTINGGTLVLKSSGLFTGAANQAITNYATLIFDAAAQSQTLNGVISGTGLLVVSAGTLTLTAANTYTGTTTVSNGTLIINGGSSAVSTFVSGGTLGGTGTLSGPVTLDLGTTLAPGASAGAVGTITINNNLSIGGNLAIEVNKSLSPSNDLVVVSGVLTNTGTGTLTVANLGPALAEGDKFTLFSKPVQNGATLTVKGSGANWANNLAVDGSITVTAVSRPTLNFTRTGNGLQFSWDVSFGNYKLQAQTNGLNVGISSNWGDYPGGETSPVTVPIDVTSGAVFFRLLSP